MGLFDDVKKAAYSAVPRKIKTNRAVTIEELYDMLMQHEDEFEVSFKLSGMFGKYEKHFMDCLLFLISRHHCQTKADNRHPCKKTMLFHYVIPP